MKIDKRANFCIFFIIALVALGLSNLATIITGDSLNTSLLGINENNKLIALDNDNFSPNPLQNIYEEKNIKEEVDNNQNDTENSTIEEYDTTEDQNHSESKPEINPDDTSGNDESNKNSHENDN